MSNEERVVILGGHGKIALLAQPKLKAAGYQVDAVIRNPAHENEITQAGGNAVVLDIETATEENFIELFKGATSIVFSAGAGGGNPQRTHAVDYEAATRAMRAAEKADVKHFIMVSYANAKERIKQFEKDDPFYPYAKAKRDADEVLHTTSLDYTILGPGLLTLEPASKKLCLAEKATNWPKEKQVTSRENVAEVIAYLVQNKVALRQTVDFYDGDVEVDEFFNQFS